MSIITVALANIDGYRYRQIDRVLQGEAGITLMGKIDAMDKWIRPRVLLVNLSQNDDENLALLISLRSECPGVHIVLLADVSVQDETIFNALEIGARGFLIMDAVGRYLPTAIRLVCRGEAWVPRKMLGCIMDRRNDLVSRRHLSKAEHV